MPIITKKEDFDSDVHNQLIRIHFSDPATVASFSRVIEGAVIWYIRLNPLSDNNHVSQHHDSLNDYLSRCICYIISRCVIGPNDFDDEQMISTFLKFNDDAINAMGLSALLPNPLRFLAAFTVKKHFKTASRTLVPIIRGRGKAKPGREQGIAFLDFIMNAVGDDERVSGKSYPVL